MTIKKEEVDTCPICLMPKAASDTGSVTQWISLCRCGTDLPKMQEKSLKICMDCGKPLAEDSDGSFTQWVVSASTCLCRHPDLIGNSRPREAESTTWTDDPDDETELELSQEHLPLDRYKPIRVVGMGGAGKVYLCRDRLLDIRVAVKILRVQSNEQLISFQQEAKAISKLSHPSIIQILNFGVTDDGRPYMVLEYIDGTSLSQLLIKNGPLEEEAAIDLFTLVADALGYANSMGIFHRDIKPSNILLTNSRPAEVRIIDFGIAKSSAKNPQTKSSGNALVGTPAYMSPDQVNNRPYDSRSEVYSFGCVLFETLSGRPPFQSEIALDLLAKHVNQAPPAINEVLGREYISEDLQAIVSTCLEKNPDDRYQSLQEVLQQLLSVRSEGKPYQSPDPIEEITQSPVISKTNLVIFSVAASAIICGAISIIIYNAMSESKPYAKTTNTPDPSSMSTLSSPEIKKAIKEGVIAFDLTFYPHINDDSFKDFKGADTVQEISAAGQQITNRALGYLKGMKRLRTLKLKDTDISDLTAIAELPNLESLNLENTKVTDDSLVSLKGLKKLKYVELKDTKVTARGLEHLVHLPSLIEVTVDFPRKLISCDDIGYLSRMYPDCNFLRAPAFAQTLWVEASRAFEKKQYQTALDRYGYAAKAFQKNGPKSYMVLIECANKSADCYSHMGKPTHADAYRAAAFNFAVKSKDFEHIRLAYKNWIVSDLEQRKFRSADSRSHELLKWLKKHPNTQKFCVDTCNQILSGLSGVDGNEKIRRFWLVEKLTMTADQRDIALTTGALAGCLKKLGEHSESLKCFEKAGRLFQQLGPTTFDWRSVVGLYCDWAGSEAEKGNLSKALELNAKSLKYTRNQRVPNDIMELLLRTRVDYLKRSNKQAEAEKVQEQLEKYQ